VKTGHAAEKRRSTAAVLGGMVEIRFANLNVFQMSWPYCCHVTVAELRKRISLLNILNREAPLIDSSAKHYRTPPLIL